MLGFRLTINDEDTHAEEACVADGLRKPLCIKCEIGMIDGATLGCKTKYQESLEHTSNTHTRYTMHRVPT